MKSRSTLVALLLTVMLALFLLILSCSPGQQNANQNQNQNRTPVSENQAVLDSNDPCKQTTSSAKKEKLRERLIAKINNDPVLKKQYHGYGEYPPGHQNDPPRFSFEVTDGQYGAVEIHFKGDISGPGQLKALVDFLDAYEKKGCLERVTFASKSAMNTPPDDFEWIYCEWPTVACPGGICANPPCAGTSNTNTNSPADGNANANANSNSNVRRGNP